jgi:hypothetical protein
MQRSASPTKFLRAWAKNAGGGFIRTVPVASQIGIQDGAASYNDGFVPDNFTLIAAGGVPPFGQDMNGVLNETTTWDQWYQAAAPIYFDSAFAAGIGGYPQCAIVQSAIVPGDFWLSTADNNTTDPDSVSAANWVPDPGSIAPGTPVPSFSSTVPFGFVAANTLTIGNTIQRHRPGQRRRAAGLPRDLAEVSQQRLPDFHQRRRSVDPGREPGRRLCRQQSDRHTGHARRRRHRRRYDGWSGDDQADRRSRRAGQCNDAGIDPG